jgi:rhodanese-related sulfurtransferase
MRTMLLAIALLAAACTKSEPAATETKAEVTLAEMAVTDVEATIAAGECTAVDANSESTRKKLGVVPGAILISDSETYIPKNELPADKSKALVFYCANEQCGASHDAAKKARIAGYTDVRVMPEGIAGWVKAGKTAQKI